MASNVATTTTGDIKAESRLVNGTQKPNHNGVAININNKSSVAMENQASNFIRPDKPSKCTWDAKKTQQPTNPHSKIDWKRKEGVLPNILHVIGNTPMVKLNKLPKSLGLKCDVYAKCEFFNPGGSVKDRIGYRMVEDAEKKGLLIPGVSTLIEPTSGNTGIGIALASAVKGYRCIIVMPLKMSNEKVDVLRALGAEIIRTPTEAAFDSPEGLIAVSQRLNKEIPNSIVLNQYTNPGNPLAHYDATGEEIYHQCNGQLDMVVLGAGTGGTITGIGRKLKELIPSCQVVGVDPEGSILAQPADLNKSDVQFYEVEGIGYDFIPTVLDRSVVDKWVKINDKESLPLARRLIRDEGLLCGGSSGAAMAGVLKAAKDLKEGQKCVVLLPDGVRNYMTKFLSDQWMEARLFQEPKNAHNLTWFDRKVSALQQAIASSTSLLNSNTSIGDAIKAVKEDKNHVLPVVDNGVLIGVVTLASLMSVLTSSGLPLASTNSNKIGAKNSQAILKKFNKVGIDSKLGLVSRILETDEFVVVIGTNAIITKLNLLSYITQM